MALILSGIAVLLGFSRLLVGLAPLVLTIVGDGAVLTIALDGAAQEVELSQRIVAIRPVTPIPHRREFQMDGSDSTNMLTFSPRYFAEIGPSPYYQLQAWLREEWRYSLWRNLRVWDRDGRLIFQDPEPPDETFVPVPDGFWLQISLERPEIPRALDLLTEDRRVVTLEINRNDKFVRLGGRRAFESADLARWYFPRDWRAPLATLLDLVARAMAIGLGLVLVVGGIGWLLPGWLRWTPGPRTFKLALPAALLVVIGASAYGAVALFDRAPHIFDAVSYAFQAKTFAAGMLYAPAPFVEIAFPMPFAVVYQDRWFSQYPPGNAALLALGYLARVPWLVQPVLAGAAVLLVTLAAARQYGRGTALLTLLLLSTSPFLLLTAGSFLSHVPALFWGALALYTITRYSETPSVRWMVLTALGLAMMLLTREIVAVLYGASIVLMGVAQAWPVRGRRIVLDGLVGGLIVLAAMLVYLGYNAAVTGSPFILPRLLFNPKDLYGFGLDIGFYGEHTIASGLVNTEEQLTSLTFALAGWPFGVSLAVPLLPFVLRRWTGWDAAHGTLTALFVAAYAAYFYHGIVFGPRYYFEALPSMLILTARGFSVLTDRVTGWLADAGRPDAWLRARQATAVLVAALLACNLVFFLPRQLTLYGGYSGMPGGGPVLDGSIERDLSGRVSRLDNALVVTDEWWYQVLYFANLNDSLLEGRAVFAYAPDQETRSLLRAVYPTRRWYDVVDLGGVLQAVPGEP